MDDGSECVPRGEGLAEGGRAAGSPCQSQWEELEDNQVLCEADITIQHYSYQRTGP